MNTKDLLTLIGGIMGCVGPLLIVEEHPTAKLIGSICMAISGLLLGQRGLNAKAPESIEVQPALEQEINSRVSDENWAPRVVIPRERRYPEQPWTPQPSKSLEQRRAEQDAWLASNKTKL